MVVCTHRGTLGNLVGHSESTQDSVCLRSSVLRGYHCTPTHQVCSQSPNAQSRLTQRQASPAVLGRPGVWDLQVVHIHTRSVSNCEHYCIV